MLLKLIFILTKRGKYCFKRNKKSGAIATMKNRQKILIQAKRYAHDIKLEHVKDFMKVIQQQNALGGFFIHSGKTGKSCYQSPYSNLQIISGKKLLNFLLGFEVYSNGEIFDEIKTKTTATHLTNV